MLLDQMDRAVIADESAVDPAQILANIRALRPFLQSRGNEIDELRRLPEDVLEAVRKTGAFRMMMPRSWGGAEMNPMQLNEALEELAMGNGAAAWCVMIQTDSGQYSGLLDSAVARQMYPSSDVTTSNVIRAAGRAQKVEGGYIVNGRWPFASGCLHADLFAGGCHLFDGVRVVLDDQGQPVHRMVIAPREQFIIHDTWYTTGLRGTGSNDIEAKNLFVPEEHVFGFDRPSHPGPLYLWPSILCAKMPGVVLGVARSAIEAVTEAMRSKKVKSEFVSLAIADAHTLYASARAYVYQSLETVWKRLEAGELPDEQERATVYLARANAFQASRQAVQLLFDAVGGPAVYGKKMPLERHLRDLTTACQHTFGQRKAQIAAAELMLGTLDKPVLFL
ncbi:MAG TPA: acyl-CoA dehydrogenase family protein [Rhodocyclaceae bacterium]|nr:acyl-CoA dehydrogenase family protein [Rhodocyclaceae bacterium]